MRKPLLRNEAFINSMYQTLREYDGISANTKRLSAPFVAGVDAINFMLEPPLAAITYIFRIGKNLSGSLLGWRRCSLKKAGKNVINIFKPTIVFFTRSLIVIPGFFYQTSVILYDPNNACSLRDNIKRYEDQR
jgi:hypothetical protein